MEVNRLSEAQTGAGISGSILRSSRAVLADQRISVLDDSEESVTGIEMAYNTTWEEKEEQSR